MNTIPRYMREYANAQRKSYANNELMQEKYKDTAVEIIEKVLKNVERGLITVDEGMRILCDPLNGMIL